MNNAGSTHPARRNALAGEALRKARSKVD